MKKRNFWLTLSCIFAVALLNVGFLYQYRFIIDAIAVGDRQAFVSYFVLMVLTVLVMLVFEYSSDCQCQLSQSSRFPIAGYLYWENF
ncbi:hypothetical protein [Streptococcus suis]|uniref:hypothetical protein n=1 Tax=Streptococcus suis TaxID=1307 RepID=UPI001EF0C9BE|nr:hypothetical protein [Streptococcus suis]MCL4901901.1 hypothetical protein [Streptococcus suis]